MPFPLFVLLAAAAADEIVVTSARAPQSAAETGQAVTVLDRELIVQRQAVVVSDLLAQTPGVAVSRNGGAGGFTGLRLRGAEAEQTLVLIDGVKVNDPSSPGGGFDFANLLADNIERIEVLRGPNSVPWGSQAIGGVVNIVTAPPSSDPTFTARAEGGSFGTAQAVANGSFTAGPVTASLGGGYFTTDGISAARTGTERDGYERYAANGRVEVSLTDSIAIDLRGYFDHGRTELDGFPAPSFTFADTPEFSTIQELFGYAGIRAAFGSLANRAAFTIADVNRDNFDAPGSSPSFIARGRVERFEYQGDLKAADWARLVFGAESERSRFGDGTSVFRTGIDSLWGELIVKPVAPLTLTGGVRHDDHRDFGGHTTFGANAALDLGATIVRASYAEGFKAPTLFQLRSDFGNPSLRPETARSIDFGVEQRLAGDVLSGSLTWFHRRTRNQIDFTACRADIPVCADGARPFNTYDNIAQARASGVEAAVDVRPSARLRINAAYSWLDAENRTPGNPDFAKPLLRRPKSSIALNVDWRAPFGLALGGTLRQVSDSADRDAFGKRVRLDSYVLADVRAAVPVSERLELYGRIENLFDARYETVLDYNTPGRAAYAGVRVRL
ncbi:TonB-dependent receptor [Sphingomonas sp. MAH-20]|uniref:TonB-dependent receptor n=1 Tax=Sphingomonas horti TaxID=2682842 RepID=A0A6I4IYI6_9SPHN|nr:MULTISPECIES: TonB-dependent receptor [Sphingomonas]MBA2920267.1 TonB-dependent receptor [Sphingomonas sp. CGMCC 1.13658]MVO76521.1 TonB-dependent receptor [Sphingomonas horti]